MGQRRVTVRQRGDQTFCCDKAQTQPPALAALVVMTMTFNVIVLQSLSVQLNPVLRTLSSGFCPILIFAKITVNQIKG